jgi:hypothetical protein
MSRRTTPASLLLAVTALAAGPVHDLRADAGTGTLHPPAARAANGTFGGPGRAVGLCRRRDGRGDTGGGR